jgi:hypothetical protein
MSRVWGKKFAALAGFCKIFFAKMGEWGILRNTQLEADAAQKAKSPAPKSGA